MNVTKALVVDDSKVAHLTLRKLLMERNIEVDWVGSGEDAIVYLEIHRPDIIFMDVMMPGMDGFETTVAIVKNAASAVPPIIMCSASATEEDKENARLSGAIEFLAKPYTPAAIDQVLEVVRELPEPVTAAVTALPQPTSGPLAGPVAPQAAVTMEQIAQIAEQSAHTTAEKVAAAVAAEIVKTSVEQLSHVVVEQTAQKLFEDMLQKATQTAVQAAQEAARSALTGTMDSFRETMRLDIDETATAAAEKAARETGDDLVKRQLSRGLAVIREEMNKQLEQHLQSAVRELLTANLSSPEFKQQLGQLVKESALPLAASSARQSAIDLTQEVTQMTADIGGQTKLTLRIAIIALLLALGAAAIGLLY